jgi:transposase-like protein
MKCEICNKKLKETFLGKYEGMNLKDEKGKLHWVCPECQDTLNNDKKAILEKIKGK